MNTSRYVTKVLATGVSFQYVPFWSYKTLLLQLIGYKYVHHLNQFLWIFFYILLNLKMVKLYFSGHWNVFHAY